MWSVHHRPHQKPVAMLDPLEEELCYLLGAVPGQERTLALKWRKQMGNPRAREGRQPWEGAALSQSLGATPFIHFS